MGSDCKTFDEQGIAQVRRLIEAEPELSRTALSRRV